jgi:hypothetical protein
MVHSCFCLVHNYVVTQNSGIKTIPETSPDFLGAESEPFTANLFDTFFIPFDNNEEPSCNE